MSNGILRLYGCGGAGINIATFFNGGKTEEGSAEIRVSAIDTSRSNLSADLNDSQCFILPDVDGSGKLRKQNHVEIASAVKQILVQQAPEDFNIVCFSASGGSGSVIGPLLISELLARNAPVVAVVIGSEESFITAQNTLNTLKSLEAIAANREQPIVMSYAHNSKDSKRSDIDTFVRFTIAALAVLASGKIAEMDRQDIANFLQYQKVTSMPARLSSLNIVKELSGLKEISNIIALANVFADSDGEPISVTPEYVATGYSTVKPVGGKSLHYAINIDEINLIVKSIRELVENLDNVRRATTLAPLAIDKNDEISATGLIL